MSWSDPVYQAVAQLVNNRTGLHFLPSRHDSAELAVRRAMAQARVTEPQRYLALLLTDATAFDHLVSELTVGETYFFREPAQFEFIRREVLPEIRQRRGPGTAIRAWSAACASGEEAYSLAIVLEQEGFAGHAYLLATDVSRPALERARLGRYSNWSLRGDGAALAEPYLAHCGDRRVLREMIRRRVTFEYLNLASDVYPSVATNTCDMDLILCRNVLIYLDPQTVRNVAARLFASLAPGGWLLTASVDPPLQVRPPCEAVVTNVGVFYRRSSDHFSPRPCTQGRGVGGEGFFWSPEQPPHPQPLSPEYGGEGGKGLPHPQPLSPADLSAQARGGEGGSRALTPDPSPGVPGEGSRKPSDPLTEARVAMGRGDYARAAALTSNLLTDVPTVLLHVRALANVDAALAERACATAVASLPLSVELQYLHAVLLLNLARDQEALQALRRVLYLDRSLAIAHFTLGSLLKQQGDRTGARRAYRNARDLAVAMPVEEVLLLADGEQAGQLVEAATFQLDTLDATRKGT